MERIQAAIAKARAARGAEPAGQRRRVAGPVPVADKKGLPDAWAKLPAFDPDPALLQRNRIITQDGGSAASAFDVLRTRVLQLTRASGWRRLAITSPSAACGKSTVALNLGLSLSRQPELRTLVIEIDMRRPALAELIGFEGRHSVAEVLTGTGSFEENAVRMRNNLAVATSHAPVHNPSDFLQSDSVATTLEAIEAAYVPHLTIFDMPPLLVNDDALAFLQHVDCALLVAAAGDTSIKEVDECERELAAHTNVLGVTLNKCRYTGRDYGAEYYYD